MNTLADVPMEYLSCDALRECVGHSATTGVDTRRPRVGRKHRAVGHAHASSSVTARELLRLALLVVVALTILVAPAEAQPDDRIRFHGQDLWLNGGNVAWINFARDIGPGETRLDLFEEMFRELRGHGGNTFRLWLHTTGAATPEWEGDRVSGPGESTIEDLRAILDLALEHDVSLMLCLWSFDMLRIRNGPDVTDRSFRLLTDNGVLDTYIRNALIPMVEALRGHPAILAWEIFNEPEGMSEEFGWPFNRHVPMADIQRFINRTAGAIKRADPSVMVTNGSWSFMAASDEHPEDPSQYGSQAADSLTVHELRQIRDALAERYGYAYSLEEAAAHIDSVRARPRNMNYYRDDRLVEAGGDPAGVLDFYTVHYYNWAGTSLSPFHHDKEAWGLDKPLVVAEFYMDDAFGVAHHDFYSTLHERGYAGALGWQWFDTWRDREGIAHNWPRVLEAVSRMYREHRRDVELVYSSDQTSAWAAQ
jgi:hypothetical protein